MAELPASPNYTPEVATPSSDTLETSSILERHPDWPRLKVLFYFSAHGNSGDMGGATPYIQEADVHLFENAITPTRVGLQEYVTDNPPLPLDQLLQNLYIEEEVVAGTLWEPIVEALYDSKKALGVMDLPDDRQYIREQLVEVIKRATPIRETLEESADEFFQQNIIPYAELQDEREHIIVKAFEDEIERILEERPDLKARPSLTICITIGAYHTRLRHALTKTGISSEREFSHMPFIYGHQSELARTYINGKKPSKELLENAWVDDILRSAISHSLGGQTVLSVPLMQYRRKLVSMLTPIQRKQIHEIHRQIPNLKEATPSLDIFLQDNHLGKLPTSPEDIPNPNGWPNKWQRLAAKALSSTEHP